MAKYEVRKRRRPSAKQLAKWHEQVLQQSLERRLKRQSQEQKKKEIEKYENIYKKEIQQIKELYKNETPLKKAQLAKAIKKALYEQKALILPREIRYAKTGIANIDEFLKDLQDLASWDNYSKMLFLKIVSLAEQYDVLVDELSAWAGGPINNQTPFSLEMKNNAEVILQIFYQLQGGSIDKNMAEDSIKPIIGS